MTECFENFLKKQDVEYIKSYKLNKKSSIGIGGGCDAALFPKTINQLIDIVKFSLYAGVKYKIFGAMTNLLISDDGFEGVVILTDKINRYFVADRQVVAECGVRVSKMIFELARMHIGGGEELYGIPGSLGGCVFGNAGAFGKSISDIFLTARLYSPSDDKIFCFDKSDMRFAYRHSVMKEFPFILLDARLNFQKSEFSVADRLSEIISQRKSQQPYGEKSLGSIFKRIDGLAVSKLIDEAGLKGYRIGGAEISKKHAGFIVNHENASAEDVRALIEFIKKEIYSLYGIRLIEEIEYV